MAMDQGMKKEECHPDWYYPVPGMRALILGTFPPHADKRHYEFYYPNKQNRFWKIMAEIAKTKLFQNEGPRAVEERKRLMTQLRVGVQNMGKTILRDGVSSADKDIAIIEFQDILGIVNENDSLQTILLTGYSDKTSTYRSFVKYLAEKGIRHSPLPEKVKAGSKFTVQFMKPITCIVGNSTSGAAARVSRERLLKQFRSAIGTDFESSADRRSPARPAYPPSTRSCISLPGQRRR
ncbi:MAG TPA: hypothetical protein VN310_14070 [Candidatus Dormibacteraeota bacterium]|jgi:G:T/U-mismatch repair DNA glycosylase|nr:hypothetical protein [Candidatus Dormibacteraeota bacterium]